MQTLEALQGGGVLRWRNSFRNPSANISILKCTWVFPKIKVPQNGWFIRKTLLKWMIWGYHYFRKDPHQFCSSESSSVFFLAKKHEKTLLCQLQSAWTTWWSRLSPVDSQGGVVSVFGGTWWIYTSWLIIKHFHQSFIVVLVLVLGSWSMIIMICCYACQIGEWFLCTLISCCNPGDAKCRMPRMRVPGTRIVTRDWWNSYTSTVGWRCTLLSHCVSHCCHSQKGVANGFKHLWVFHP